MTVYVDDSRIPWRGWRMSHLTADTEDELHAFATSIGLRRSWFQGGRHPHYDVTDSKRAEAIRLGAVSETWREAARRTIKARANA